MLRSSGFPRRPLLSGLQAQQLGRVEQVLGASRAQFQQEQARSLGNAYNQALNFHGRRISDNLRFPGARRKEEITPDCSGGDGHVKANQAANRVVEGALPEGSR